MAGPGVFHVEFGINETSLTRALELQHYKEAEMIINECAHHSFLDEGCYERTPLYIVLCGSNQENCVAPRNLFLADKLVHHGADVNYRIPSRFIGAEYMGPGYSPLELLVNFYNFVTHHSGLDIMDEEESDWDPYHHVVVGLDNKMVLTYTTLLEQLEALTLSMLGRNGDILTRDELGMTLLHRVAVHSKEVDLLHMLCDAGGDVNATDLRKNSVLGAVCDPTPFGVEQDWEPVCCYSLSGREHILDVLLTQPGCQLDLQNRQQRTALFSCCCQGQLRAAGQLLAHGADPSLKGKLFRHRTSLEASPLFACLSVMGSATAVEAETAATHMEHQLDLQALAALLDKGYFNHPDVTTELHGYIDCLSPNLVQLKALGDSLVNRLFGCTSSTLQQLTTRKIFSVLAANRDWPLNYDFYLGDLSLDDASNHEGAERPVSHPPSLLEAWVVVLGLPLDTLLSLQVELFRHLLLQHFSNTTYLRLVPDGEEGYSWLSDQDSSSTSSALNDSDIEYW